MQRITEGGSHYDSDTLDDVPLFDNEALHLQWPDGTVEGVRVETYTEKRGSIYYVAYLPCEKHGATGRIPLVGMSATRVNPPKFRVGALVHVTCNSPNQGITWKVQDLEWENEWMFDVVPLLPREGVTGRRMDESELAEGLDPVDAANFALVLNEDGVEYRPL